MKRYARNVFHEELAQYVLGIIIAGLSQASQRVASVAQSRQIATSARSWLTKQSLPGSALTKSPSSGTLDAQ